MKKAILIVLIAGMASWALYEFISSSMDTTVEEDTGSDTSDGETNEDPSSDADGQAGDMGDVGLSEGDKAPDFELTTLEGDKVQLSDLEGERVIVNFWATWCPPCREEIPDLQKLYDNKDVEILAVNMTDSEENEETVHDFVDNYEMDFPKPLDKDGEVAEKYEVAAYPTSYMIGSDGRIQYRAMGAMPYDVMTEELAKVE